MPESPLLERLKERKLVQWTLAYLAGSWVLFEVSDAVGGRWDLPDVIYQGLSALLVVGFFVTLVLAWYHGEKGRQRVSGPELLMVAALLVVAGVALSTLGGGGHATEAAPAVIKEDGRPVVAVLPLDNLSPDPDQAFFAGGVQEDLTSKLSRISSLAVISRSSVEQYRDRATRPPLRQIATELGANYLVEGSARIGGDSVRITVQLIEGDTDLHIWSGDFDAAYSVDTYVRLQAEIVQGIAFELRAAISPEDLEWLEVVPTPSLEALEDFMRGNEEYLDERLSGSTTNWERLASIRWYESALELDPDFPLAMARLALSGTNSFDYTDRAAERVERLARRALALSPDLPEARLALARSVWASGGREDAMARLQRTERSYPDDPEIGLQLATYRKLRGEYALAIQGYERLERLSPRDPLIPRALQYSYIHAHRYDEALEAADRQDALLASPNAMLGVRRAYIYLARGERRRAEEAITELLGDDPGVFYRYRIDGPFRVMERLISPEQRMIAFEAVRARGQWEGDEGRPNTDFFTNAATHEAALGRTEESRAYWDSLRTMVERAPPSSDAPRPRVRRHLTLLTYSYLGLEEHETAIETARRLVEEVAQSDCRSYREGLWLCALLARVYAHFGEYDAAIDLLEEILPAPSWLTVHVLEADPIWDPLRDQPRFQALLEKYADDVEH
jgi:TolB-like protein/tetratricopeptide (TPR) repeat protein